MSSLIRRHPLTAFFALAFLISWTGVAPLVASRTGLIDRSVSPTLHALGALGPFLAAFVVTRIADGSQGVRDLWGRMRQWRVPMVWWALGVLSPFALFALAYVITGATLGAWPRWTSLLRASADPQWVLDLLIAAVCYGLGEETGWRGFAQPRLQAGRSALGATSILAFFWGIWHLPFFFYRFPWGGPMMIVGFFIGLLAGAVWLTFLLNSTGGSILIVALWHLTWNVVNVGGTQVSGEVLAWMSGLVITLAVVVLIIGRPSRLSTRTKFVHTPAG